MNDLEDRLRDAYRAAAGTVRPETVRDLHVSSVRPHRGGQRGVRWTGLVMPLGAAVTVAALVLGVFELVPRDAHAGHGTAVPREASGRAQAAAAPLPEFIVSADGSSLDVIRTATGRAAGKITAPAGQSFDAVAGTADDRTFLVTADLNPQTACQTFLYQVRLSNTGQPSAPVPLAFSSLAGVLPTAVAMSADGRTAVLSTVTCAAAIAGHTGGTPGIGGFYLLNVTAGKVTRQWTYALPDDYTHEISLSADGRQLTYMFLLPPGNSQYGIEALATTAPSGTLDSVSHVVLRPAAKSGVDAAELSPDGSTLYACTSVDLSYPDSITSLVTYRATTGRRTRVLRTWPPAAALSCDLTMDPSGRNLLVAIGDTPDGKLTKPTRRPMTRSPVTTRLYALDLAGGRFTTLPTTFEGPAVHGGLAW